MQLVYYGEHISKSVDRLARFGYDAIELVGDPTAYDIPALKRACADTGLVVSSVGSLPITPDRDLVHPEAGFRTRALDYFRQTMDFAADMGASVVIVNPSTLMKTKRLASEEQEWEWAVEGIQAVGEYAASVGVDIVCEAWNRYETYFINTLEQAAELWNATGLTNGGVMGDTFHMNIEEESLPGAFRKAGSLLKHVHIADSTRSCPGRGHTDFKPIVDALVEIDYQGYLSMEMLPAAADPLEVMKTGAIREFFDPFTKAAIEHLKSLEPGS
jgi:sugar phosphate isomerase/epimerase